MSCPRCGADNQCAVATKAQVSAVAPTERCAGDLSCWCFQVQLTPEQRALLPKSTSCYCAACLDFLVQEIQA
jgi:hypothetical protein